jgi:hypothetical protein
MSGSVPDRGHFGDERDRDELDVDPDEPISARGSLLDRFLPAEAHYAAVAADDDPDLRS